MGPGSFSGRCSLSPSRKGRWQFRVSFPGTPVVCVFRKKFVWRTGCSPGGCNVVVVLPARVALPASGRSGSVLEDTSPQGPRCERATRVFLVTGCP